MRIDNDSKGQLVRIPVCSCLFELPLNLGSFCIRGFAIAQHKIGAEVNQLDIGRHQSCKYAIVLTFGLGSSHRG